MAQHTLVFYPYDPLPAASLNEMIAFYNGIAAGTNLEPNSVTASNIDLATLPLRTKVIQSTRSSAEASGDVSYTGVGFRPRTIECIMTVNNTIYTSHGFCDENLLGVCMFTSNTGIFNINANKLIAYSNVTSWAQTANVVSLDADGFTLGWTLVGSPVAGTLQLLFMCRE